MLLPCRIEGEVGRVNATGLQIAGHDGWLKLSEHADAPRMEIPVVGEWVYVDLDSAGHVRLVAVVPRRDERGY